MMVCRWKLRPDTFLSQVQALYTAYTVVNGSFLMTAQSVLLYFADPLDTNHLPGPESQL